MTKGWNSTFPVLLGVLAAIQAAPSYADSYAPQVEALPDAPQTFSVRCDGPRLKWADCHFQARKQCAGNFLTLKASEADFPAAGPWRRGGGRGDHTNWGDDDSGVPKPVQRTLQYRCSQASPTPSPKPSPKPAAPKP